MTKTDRGDRASVYAGLRRRNVSEDVGKRACLVCITNIMGRVSYMQQAMRCIGALWSVRMLEPSPGSSELPGRRDRRDKHKSGIKPFRTEVHPGAVC